MTVTFELKTDPNYVDAPLVNLRNKEFSRVELELTDGNVFYFIPSTNLDDDDDFALIIGDCVINLYSEYFAFTYGKLINIIPYSSISRWVLCL